MKRAITQEEYEDYHIVCVGGGSVDEAISRLLESIRSWLKDGWLLQGGVSLTVVKYANSNAYTICQAVVKVKEDA